jgi:hypothetical protein
MKVADPDGNIWRVTRRWLPWRRRFPARGALNRRGIDLGGFGGADLDGAFGLAVAVVALFIALPGLILLILVGIELLALLALLPLAILARILIGRTWYVEVRKGFASWHEEPAGRWTKTGERIAKLANDIEQGYLPPPTLVRSGSNR